MSRAVIVTLVVAALGVGGFLAYQRLAPPAAEAPAQTITPARERPPRPSECGAIDAHYTYREDPALRLRFVHAPDGMLALEHRDLLPEFRPLILEVSDAVSQRTFRFMPASSTGYALNFLYPAHGDRLDRLVTSRMEVSFFDEDMKYVSGIPAASYAAPAHIYAPGVARYLYAQGGERRIDVPVSFFDFQRCETQEVRDLPPPSASP